MISQRGESRTPKATKMEIFVPTTNDSHPLTGVIKNFILDATDARSTCLTLNQTLRRLKISPSHCSHQALYPLCFSRTKVGQ